MVDIPVKNAHLLGRLLSTIPFQKLAGSDGDIIEQTEASRLVLFSMVTWGPAYHVPHTSLALSQKLIQASD